MSDAALQSAAESFVQRRLLTDEAFKHVAQIGPREALALRDSYSRVSTVSNGKETTSALMSRAFVFERRYDGIPFVGPGNKAVVRLSPTGQVIGLQIMLPRLVPTGRTLRVMNGRRLSAGLSELGATVPGKARRDLMQMRCGYFDDAGGRRQPRAGRCRRSAQWTCASRRLPTGDGSWWTFPSDKKVSRHLLSHSDKRIEDLLAHRWRPPGAEPCLAR